MFQRKTVDGILTVFNKTIADLSAVAQEQTLQAEQLRVEAQQAAEAAKRADIEASRASTVAAQLATLIGSADGLGGAITDAGEGIGGAILREAPVASGVRQVRR